MKVSACLEELKELRKYKGDDFDFESHTINIRAGESRSEDVSKAY